MTLEQARAAFSADRFACDAAKITIEDVGPHFALCRMPITEQHLNSAGHVMGGALYTLADFAFAVAANQDERVLTVSLVGEIRYFAAAGGGFLTAEARCEKDGASACFYRVCIYDADHTLVADVNMTGFHRRKNN